MAAPIASLMVTIGADIADLKRSTEKVESTLGGVSASAAKLGKMLAGAFTVGTITAAIQKTLQYASSVDDASKKLGISIEATQRYKFAAEQTGASLENVSKSVLTLSRKLAGDDKAAKEALDAAGLSFKAIREMKPEEAFNATAVAIAKLPNPMKQAQVTLDLWGKSGLELLPAIREGFVELGDSITVMSDTTVDRLAKAEDAWEKLGTTVTIVSGEIISGIAAFLGAVATIKPSMSQAEGAMTNGFSAAKVAVGDTTTTAQQFAAEMNALRNEMPGIVANIASPFADLGLALDDTAAQKEAFDKMLRDAASSIEAERANRKYLESVSELAHQFSGGALAAQVKKLGDAVIEAGGAAKMTAYEKAQLRKQIGDLQAQGAKLPPVLQEIIDKYNEMKAHAFPVVSTLDSIKIAMGAVKQMALSMPDRLIPVMKLPTHEATAQDVLAWQEGLNANIGAASRSAASVFAGNFKDFLQTGFPQAIMGAIQGGGSVIEAAGSSVGSFLMSDKGIGSTITKGAKALFGDKLGAAIGSALPGLGAMLGPMISGLFGKLFGSAGRDAVKEFAASMGGFDALREKLLPLGDVGEKLWINLTQGVGKNNPEQAKAAIEAITRALQEQEQFIAGLVPSWKDTLELAEKYGLEVSKLGEKFEQARLADMANTIAVDFRKLIAAGVDMNTVLTGMQDEVQGVVTNALQMGIEIPDSLRPVIQKMVELGMLTDASGNKMVDLTKLNFSETLSQSVNRIIEALDRLIEKLDQGVGGAIRAIPRDVDVRVGWRISQFPGLSGSTEDDLDRFHNGGWIKAHHGMNKVLPFKLGAGEVPIIAQSGEAVLNRQAAARLGEAGVAALNAGGGASAVDMGAVVAELRGQRADARRAAAMAPGLTARAMRDAMLLAG